MFLHFKVRYRTQYGQSVWLLYKENHPEAKEIAFSLSFHDQDHWQGVLELSADFKSGPFLYRFQIRQDGRVVHEDFWMYRSFHLQTAAVRMDITDHWQHQPSGIDVFRSRAFKKVLLNGFSFQQHIYTSRPTHIIQVNTSMMQNALRLCIIGAGDALGNWSVKTPLLFNWTDGLWTLGIDLGKVSFPLEYKLGLYDEAKQEFVAYENGDNRILGNPDSKAFQHIVNTVAYFEGHQWKGTGLNVQLSSLKTSNSWGAGDFSDLKMLTDWCRATSINMLQLLPINDTISSFTKKDSYPYSAVSAFAQHPIFLNVLEMAAVHEFELPATMIEKGKQLNEHATLQYDDVVALKLEAARAIFSKAATTFSRKKNFKSFFADNEHWLEPYAVFSALRDEYKTSNTSLWNEYGTYHENDVESLLKPKSKFYKAIQFYFFLQYHLHLQLCDAVEYAHAASIIIKGDLPIGVGRHSVDTWKNPELFHMNMQAGAPPDAFAVKGQNWSFPTYNWEMMKRDGYAWWKQRLQHMSQYFDATRIDHVLGFFRIWSIPMTAIDGDFGTFVPAIPFDRQDFDISGIPFDEHRYCEPYISESILRQRFGNEYNFITSTFFDGYRFKAELNTQKKIEDYAQIHGLDANIKRHLFDLLSEVMLWQDESKEGNYHFRIGMQQTRSFQELPEAIRNRMDAMYVDYFYKRQNQLWHESALEKLDAIQQSSDMMICAEDLGMVPEMVEQVLQSRQMLALQVQRMPKQSDRKFSHPADAPYLSVVTPSTHDMSTIREWWEEDRNITTDFCKNQLDNFNIPPVFCEPQFAASIVNQHMQSPAMWSVFLLQDLLAMDAGMRRVHPAEERINIPADPNHFWNYRMHINIESLFSASQFNSKIIDLISASGRN
jgi:4-alpha-glucanotransferase